MMWTVAVIVSCQPQQCTQDPNFRQLVSVGERKTKKSDAVDENLILHCGITFTLCCIVTLNSRGYQHFLGVSCVHELHREFLDAMDIRLNYGHLEHKRSG